MVSMQQPLPGPTPQKPRKPASDGELVERARSGERSAFEELVQRYTGSLFVYVLSRVANRDALVGDATQAQDAGDAVASVQ